MNRQDLLVRAEATVRDHAHDLIALSHTIHGLAETAFDEGASSAGVAAVLREAGFAVEGVEGLPTALIATYGAGEFTVGVCAEYDALPEIGHACGHNIVAASAVGAAMALATVADELGLTVKLLGTPAEERGGGKILMLEAGVFDDLTCALMVHPGPVDCAASTSQGVSRFAVTYTGKASHAAAAPHLGINASDAAVIAQVAIALLRQQLPATARVASLVSDGGRVTNIIPDHVVIDVEVREFDIDAQRALQNRVMACFEAGALATGCAMSSVQTEPPYAPLKQDRRLGLAYTAAAAGLGRQVQATGIGGGSTDMGNVSRYLPAIHPIVAILGSANAPHTVGFAADAHTPAADRTVLDGAIALAHTIVDVASAPTVRQSLLAEQNNRRPYSSTKEY